MAAGVVLSMLRFGPKLVLTGLQAPTLTAPFAKVVDQVVTDPWLRKFLDLECFVLRCVKTLTRSGQGQSQPGPYLDLSTALQHVITFDNKADFA